MVVKNKKIKNATPNQLGNIKFKSKLETNIYKTLIKEGFTPQYEEHKFILWEGFRPSVPFYTRDKYKNTVLKLNKLINITYTPDFYLEYKGLKIIIEAKGMVNDVYPYKFKMFRKVIEKRPDKEDFMLFEIYTKKQLLESIQIIKAYATNRQNEKSDKRIT